MRDDVCVLRGVGAAKTYRLIAADGREIVSTTPGRLGGHRRTKVYGRLDCPVALGWIARGSNVRHRVFFADEQTAIAAGYRPCGACMREEYRRWKEQSGPHQDCAAPRSNEMHRAGGDFVRLSD